MKQLLALTVCVSILIPSTALAGEPSNDQRLILSGTEAKATMAKVMRAPSQNSAQQSTNDDKLLGMHWAVTQSLFAAGIGAAIGTVAVRRNTDSEGNSLAPTGGDRARGALIGAATGTGLFGFMQWACSKGCF